MIISKNIEKENYEDMKSFISKICLQCNIDEAKIQIINRDKPHKIESLDDSKMAIYTFSYKGKYLKIGKVSSKSNARFKYQHYKPNSTKSNLAKSLLYDKEFCGENSIDENNLQEWMKNNLQRIDIILDKDLNIFTLNLFEACLHYKYKPKYEGYKSQKN